MTGPGDGLQLGQGLGVAVGLDLVDVAQVRAGLAAHGERYLRRLFTEREVADCAGDPGPRADGLAARLAAKEATLKALRPRDHPNEPTDAVPAWTEIEVVRHPDGWCSLSLTGIAARLKERAGVIDLTLSMSHEGDIAAAVVVGVTTGAGRTDVEGSLE